MVKLQLVFLFIFLYLLSNETISHLMPPFGKKMLKFHIFHVLRCGLKTRLKPKLQPSGCSGFSSGNLVKADAFLCVQWFSVGTHLPCKR